MLKGCQVVTSDMCNGGVAPSLLFSKEETTKVCFRFKGLSKVLILLHAKFFTLFNSHNSSFLYSLETREETYVWRPVLLWIINLLKMKNLNDTNLWLAPVPWLCI